MAESVEQDGSSDSYSLRSSYSDEEPLLPSYTSLISSPAKKIKIDDEPQPETQTEPQPEPQASIELFPEVESPLKIAKDYQNTTRCTRRLAREMRQLSDRTKERREMDEKLSSFELQGGIIGMDQALDEEEDEVFGQEPANATEEQAQQPVDNSLSFPLNPPEKALFVHPPSLIEKSDFNSDVVAIEHNSATMGYNILVKCQSKTCPPEVWQSLFKIMCRSSDDLLSQRAFSNLMQLVAIAKSKSQASTIFCPKSSDISQVLEELGMNKEQVANGQARESKADNAQVGRSIHRLIQYIAACVNTSQEQYPITEVEFLIELLVNLSLDGCIQKYVMLHEITSFIDVLIHIIPASNWTGSMERLVMKLTALCEHHHQYLYVCRLIPGSDQISSQLRTILCRKSIELVLKDRQSFDNVTEKLMFAKKVFNHYLLVRKASFNYELFYEMYSVLYMLSLFLIQFKGSWENGLSKKDFLQLMVKLGNRFRDDGIHSGKTMVKDLLVRMKLDFEKKEAAPKQTNIKAYCN